MCVICMSCGINSVLDNRNKFQDSSIDSRTCQSLPLFLRTLTLCYRVTGLAAGIQTGGIWPLPFIHPRHRSAL